MPSVDRDRFLEEGYLIIRDAIPADKLESVRRSYEPLVERQVEIWRSEDPAGNMWDTHKQPRINLTAPSLATYIDDSLTPAVDVWFEENIRGVSTALLEEPDAAVAGMMMMCNPVTDHGPSGWHRDLHPIDTAPLQGYIDDIVETGPRYVQWNIPLYDDSVLYVIPRSHLRYSTAEETEMLREDLGQPLPGGVQTHLDAGDGVVYCSPPILHWGSNYSPLRRRTLHGGFSTYTHHADLSFKPYLPQDQADAFERWERRTETMHQQTETALRAVIDGDGDGYLEAIRKLHPRRGEKGELLTTVFLCKATIAIGLTKELSFSEVPAELEERISGTHAASFNWGEAFADRFTAEEAKALWRRFEPLDALLQMEEEHFVPGFQQRTPMRYHFNDMPEGYTAADFIESWESTV